MNKYRVFSIIYTILMLSASVFVILQITDVWQNALYVYLPLMMLGFYVQTYLNWANSRKLAICYLIVSLVGTVACVTMLFI